MLTCYKLYSDVAVYNDMISVPEQAEMAVDIACRTALAQRGVSHLTIPIDVQEKRLSGKFPSITLLTIHLTFMLQKQSQVVR